METWVPDPFGCVVTLFKALDGSGSVCRISAALATEGRKHRITSAEILLQGWYLDDGALVGTHPAVLRALHLIEEMGPALGLHVNLGPRVSYSVGRATPHSHILLELFLAALKHAFPNN